MDLICVERMALSDICVAKRDQVIFSDMRVLNNLLELEPVYMLPCNYFGTVQKDIEPFMRKIVATWMMEVCEEQGCENQVFPLSVNFLDRFLCTTAISRQQLQLVAAVCLLIVSKIRQCHALTVDLLSTYTDRCCSTELIKSWELLVLSTLKWNLTGVTGFDYVDHVIERLPVCQESPTVRRHAHTLVTLCYVEPEYIQTPGSLVATAALISSLRGLNVPFVERAVETVLTLMHVNIVDAEPIILHLEAAIQRQTAEVLQQSQPATNKNSGSATSTNTKQATMLPDESETGQPETPTDVSDVHF